MKLETLLTLNCTATRVVCSSKKAILEQLSELLSQGEKTISAHDIFNCFIERERLGSTAMGYGIAIPHARLSHLKAPKGALLQLEKGVDFQSPDQEPVDIIFGLIVPEAAVDEHLQMLSQIAILFNSMENRQALRKINNATALYDTMIRFSHASSR